MAERFFDDLARTLAQPMPRRRALRVVGTSLVGAMVAGTSPLRASAALGRRSEVCKGKPTKCNCSGAIAWCPTGCPYDIWKCECQPFGKGVQAVCVSTSTCPEPQRHCGPCCPNGQRCNTLLGECDCSGVTDEPCPPYGRTKPKACCRKGTTCCANNTSSTCCGPDQTCQAAGRTKAVCKCKPGKGTPCGTKCCEKGRACCPAPTNGELRCCDKGEFCTELGGCCPKSTTICKSARGSDCCRKDETCLKQRGCCQTTRVCGADCCGPGEYCFWKKEGDLTPLVGTCKNGCVASNVCGTQCCGSGYTCSGKACVPA